MISFGTDGWRGVIADDFTFDNVRIVTQAVCDYVREQRNGVSTPYPLPPSPVLVIGYDTRFLSDKFAQAAAEVAAGNGIKVLLTAAPTPTPAVSLAVVDNKSDGAIMFTASHNPYKYNGLKFKAPYGGSASPEITDAIEVQLEKNDAAGKAPVSLDFEGALAAGAIEIFDAKEPYLKRLGELVDTGLLKGAKVVIDPMFGAGCGYLSDFLRSHGCEVLEIHGTRDPYFGDGQPEPLGRHLDDLTEAVTGKWPLGVALDGDADRIGAVDRTGEFISSHVIISLLIRYLNQEKGLAGDIVKTVSTTGMVDILAAEYGLTLHETPIGFKYICDIMVNGDVLIGGEESGGIGIKGHIPERDGILVGAMLVEMMGYYGLTVGELWREVQNTYGCFCYDRIDKNVSGNVQAGLLNTLDKYCPRDIDGITVTRINKMDGYKYCLADNSWLMLRLSGTEPMVRIYSEAGSKERVDKLLRFGADLISGEVE